MALVAALGVAAGCGPADITPAERTVWSDLPKHEARDAADPTAGLTGALEAASVSRPARLRASRSKVRPASALGSCTLDEIRRRESGGRYDAVSRTGKYRGAYQFDQRTWASVGGSGDPAAAAPEEQDARAAELMRRRGSQPWSVCR